MFGSLLVSVFICIFNTKDLENGTGTFLFIRLKNNVEILAC